MACLLALVVSGILSFVFSIMVFIGFVTAIGSAMEGEQKNTIVKQGAILHIDLGMELSDNPSSDPLKNIDFANFEFKKTQSLMGAIAKIKAAANDSRISGIYLDFPLSTALSMDGAYQLRQALEAFKESNKFVISYSEAYSQGSYYLASVSDMIYLNPAGAMDWRGMSFQMIMFKGLLDKLGVKAEIFRHGKFKGAVEPFMLEKASDENRTQMGSLATSVWDDLVSVISESRGIPVDSLQSYANNLSIEDCEDALELGFVDSLTYLGSLYDHMATLSGGDEGKPNFVKLSEYNPSGRHDHSLNKIAVLYAVGDIVNEGNPSQEIVAEPLRKEIAKLANNDNVKAVVLRVNSPGGSVLASEVILNELQRLKSKKPLVVSMGTYAASGGYFISCFADRIIANPNTITGSIGVFGMMFNVEKGAKELLGINVDVVGTNKSSDLGNKFRPMTDAERLYMQRGVDQIYDRFIGLVSEGRGLDLKFVDSIAQGRVWSGIQAKELGLVDQLGTLADAIVVAKELAGDDQCSVDVYPKSDNSGFAAAFRSALQAGAKIVGLGDSPEDLIKKEMQKLAKNQGVVARLPYQVELR